MTTQNTAHYNMIKDGIDEPVYTHQSHAAYNLDVVDAEMHRLDTVDHEIADAIDGLEEDKVDKTNGANKLYGTDSDGNQKLWDTSSFGGLEDDPDWDTTLPGDTDKLSWTNLSTSKVKSIMFHRLWDWVVGKLANICMGGIEVSFDGNLQHTNNIPAQTTASLRSLSYDAQGHITGSTAKSLGRGIDDQSNVIGHSNSVTSQTAGFKSFAFDGQGHITSATGKSFGRGINDSSNTIGHSNAEITAKSNTNIVGLSYDKYGHITGKGTEQTLSDTYTSTADNQIFTRKGAYNMYSSQVAPRTKMVGIFTSNTAQSTSSGNWTTLNITSQNDNDSAYCYRSGNSIYIAKSAIYRFTITTRLADTAGGNWIAWTTSMSGARDDISGGEWKNSSERHKMTTSVVLYCTAGTTIRPEIIIVGGNPSTRYVQVVVDYLK